ncbi:MAG: PIN domain-containing protein [Pseudomonadota bacterium]
MTPDLPKTPRVVLDACVLYPTILRTLLLKVAARGLFTPVWSARLLEEWARAAARRGALDEAGARGEIALLRAAWPAAEQLPAPGIEARLWLPDANDVHVLATAIASSADGLLTRNVRDFPRGTLREEGVARYEPDGFLMALWLRSPEDVDAAVAALWDAARRVEADSSSSETTGTRTAPHAPPSTVRGLLKKAQLPRLAKALSPTAQ